MKRSRIMPKLPYIVPAPGLFGFVATRTHVAILLGDPGEVERCVGGNDDARRRQEPVPHVEQLADPGTEQHRVAHPEAGDHVNLFGEEEDEEEEEEGIW